MYFSKLGLIYHEIVFKMIFDSKTVLIINSFHYFRSILVVWYLHKYNVTPIKVVSSITNNYIEKLLTVYLKLYKPKL